MTERERERERERDSSDEGGGYRREKDCRGSTMSCPYRGTMVLPSPRKSYRGSSSMLTRVRASLSMCGSSSSSSGDAGVREHSSYARGKGGLRAFRRDGTA